MHSKRAPQRKRHVGRNSIITKTTQALSGQPVRIKDGHSFIMSCCGCKLSHFIHVKKKGKDEVALKVFVDEYETKQARKGKKKR